VNPNPAAISRRRFLGFLGGCMGATAVGVAVAEPHERVEPKPGAIGMLYDASKCIGCKACVAECARVNDLAPDTELSGGLWAMPLGLDTHTKNVIQLYKSEDGTQTSFVKRQCMHCVDPACVEGCPFSALFKDDKGIVKWDGDRCIGCRYCQVACPYQVPKFEWDAFNPRIVKCEFCSHVLGRPESEGGQSEPGCTRVCPTGAVIFGLRSDLLEDAKERIASAPGSYFEDRVYGEKEGGGTQVLYLSKADVPFKKLGLPGQRDESSAHIAKKLHRFFTDWAAFPVVLYGVFAFLIKRNWKEHEEDVARAAARDDLTEQL
jgi:Fe-S-cluster-containing dehydrogenase component